MLLGLLYQPAAAPSAGLFNRFIFNNAVFNTGAEIPDAVVGGGGGGPVDYRNYQKQLRKIAKAADERLYGKVVKRLEAIREQDDAPAVITNVIREIEAKIDFAALARNESQQIHGQLLKLLLRLEQLVAQEAEDELIILMAI